MKYNKKDPKEQVTAMIMVTPAVRELMRERAVKKERYSDYILRLMKFEEEHRHNE